MHYPYMEEKADRVKLKIELVVITIFMAIFALAMIWADGKDISTDHPYNPKNYQEHK